jgi:indolepyruvate ferredoxin oxidoreductase beta subunit
MGDAGGAAGMTTSRATGTWHAQGERLTLLIAALGGQGGGVLTEWIVGAARAEGLTVQATSTPGVSQRTGGTTYYIEIAAASGVDPSCPALALTPLPGRIDVLVCAELLEAARMLERGMSTPTRTTVIASTHRTYTTREKMHADDGRFDSNRIVDAVRKLSREAILFDMEGVAARHGATISAVLFGALAGSGTLPLGRSSCEATIVATGKGVEPSLAAFAEGFALAVTPHAQIAGAGMPGVTALPTDASLPAELAARIAALPPPVAEIARAGAARAVDFQDVAYAQRYLDRVDRIARAEIAVGASAPGHAVARETARHLALWMCYDDAIRVASLKARASRLDRIRREARADRRDVVRVFDCFKPSSIEIAAVLPRSIGAWLERRTLARGTSREAGRRLTLQVSSMFGALLLRLAAASRPLRPRSLRFAREQTAIDEWLVAVERTLTTDMTAGPQAAYEVARLPRLRKGYGDTHARGSDDFRRMLALFGAESGGDLAGSLAALHAMDEARVADPDRTGHPSLMGAGGPRPRAQRVVWADRRGPS